MTVPNRSTPPPLARDLRWTSVAVAVYAVTQWLLVIGMVRLAGLEQFGGWAYAAALVTPITMLGGLKLRSVVVTDMTNEGSLRLYRQLAAIGECAALFVVVVLASVPVTSRHIGSVIVCLGAWRAFDALADVEYAWMQRQFQFRLSAICVALNSATSVGLVLVTLLCGGTLAVAAAAGATASLGVLIFARMMVRRTDTDQSSQVFDRTSLFRLARRVLPLGAANGLNMFMLSFPRIALEWIAGREAVGIFASLNSLLSAAGLPANAIGQAATPRLARSAASGNRMEFGKLLRIMILCAVCLGAALCVGTIFLGQWIAVALYGDAVGQHWCVMLILAVGIGCGMIVNFLGAAANARRQFREQLWVAGATVVAGVIAQVVFVSFWGLQGAAWGVVIAVVCQGLLYWRLVAPTGLDVPRGERYP